MNVLLSNVTAGPGGYPNGFVTVTGEGWGTGGGQTAGVEETLVALGVTMVGKLVAVDEGIPTGPLGNGGRGGPAANGGTVGVLGGGPCIESANVEAACTFVG